MAGILDILKSIGGAVGQGASTAGQGILSGLQAAGPVLGQAALGGGQAMAEAMQAQGNPLAFQAQQQRQMEQMREDWEDKQGQLLTAFQQASLNQMHQMRDDRNTQWITQMQQQGVIDPANPGEDGAQEISGHWFKPSKPVMVTPPPELASILGTNPLPMNKLDPGVASLIGDVVKGQRNKGQAQLDLKGALDQVDELFPVNPDSPDDPNNVLNKRYKNMFTTFSANGDKTRMDTLLGKLDDADRESKQRVKEAGEKVAAEDEAGMKAARIDLPDAQLDYWYRQIKMGRLSEQDAVRSMGISDKYGRRRWNEYLAQRGDPLPVALSTTAQNHLQAMVPVNDSLKKLMAMLEPYKNDGRPAGELLPRLKYALGIGDENSGLISLGEMDKLRGAAQSLTGLRTALPIFEQAQVHTPNFWKGSRKQMYEQVKQMSGYLDTNIDDIFKYGAKTGVVQPQGRRAYEGGSAAPTPIPTLDFGTPPPPPR